MNLCQILFSGLTILVCTALVANSDDITDKTRKDKPIGKGVIEAVVDLILKPNLDMRVFSNQFNRVMAN